MQLFKSFIIVIQFMIVFGIIFAWPINIYRLSNCDFKSDYKCEVTHTIGVVVAPASLVTVWFDTDN